MEKQKKNNYILIALVIGTVLTVLGTVVYMFVRDGNGGGGESSDSSSFIPAVWLPVWVAIMAARNKKKTDLASKERMILMIAVGILVLLVALGLFVFLFALK